MAAKKKSTTRGKKKAGVRKKAAGARGKKKATAVRGKKKASRRELISPRGNRRFVRRAEGGQFGETDDARRSLAQDRPKKAKRKVRSGQGDRGDR